MPFVLFFAGFRFTSGHLLRTAATATHRFYFPANVSRPLGQRGQRVAGGEQPVHLMTTMAAAAAAAAGASEKIAAGTRRRRHPLLAIWSDAIDPASGGGRAAVAAAGRRLPHLSSAARAR